MFGKLIIILFLTTYLYRWHHFVLFYNCSRCRTLQHYLLIGCNGVNIQSEPSRPSRSPRLMPDSNLGPLSGVCVFPSQWYGRWVIHLPKASAEQLFSWHCPFNHGTSMREKIMFHLWKNQRIFLIPSPSPSPSPVISQMFSSWV